MFTFYEDPAHGWLAVPFKLIEQLGLAEQITPCSYCRQGQIYLEEDLDASTFLCAYLSIDTDPEHWTTDEIAKVQDFWINHCNRVITNDPSIIRTYAKYSPSHFKTTKP